MGLCIKGWAANPDGDGVIQAGLNALAGFPSEAGNQIGPVPAGQHYHEYQTQQSDFQIAAYGAIPLSSFLTAELSANTEDSYVQLGRNVPGVNAYYDEETATQYWLAQASARLYLASLFGRDWNPDLDHPEGVVGWPVLWASGNWISSNTQWQLLDNVNFNVTLPPDLSRQSSNVSAGLVLPLDTCLALNASYDRNIYNQAQQGSFGSANRGTTQTFNLGASYHFQWRSEDKNEFYFPRMGRPGQVLLNGSVFSERAYAQDANLMAGLGLSVGVPFSGAFAATLGWNWAHQYTAPFDHASKFTETQLNQDAQRLYVRLGYAFGAGAAPVQRAEPAAAPSAASVATPEPAATPTAGQTPAGAANQGVGNTPPPEPTIK